MSVSGINQLQMLYETEEDRFFFRVNSADKKEFRFWLTRRYMILMIKVLREHFDMDPDIVVQDDLIARQAVKSFKQEQAVQDANFKQSFNEEAKELPLGDAAQLAFRLSYRVSEENLHLTIQPKQGEGINLTINRQINSSMMALMQSAAKKADWRLESWFEPTQGSRSHQDVVN